MKHILPILVIAAMLFVGCEQNAPAKRGTYSPYSVANNTYEKVYSESEIWQLVFTTDSLHTYWIGKLEVSASYTQENKVVECISTNGNHFTIIAEEDYDIYDDKTFTKKLGKGSKKYLHFKYICNFINNFFVYVL